MKRKDWRSYQEPPKPKHTQRRRKGGFIRKVAWSVMLFLLGYGGFMTYYMFSKPYTVVLDAGHGGDDVGAVGVIEEVALTEMTVNYLKELLVADGRFRVITTRSDGETKTIAERNQRAQRFKPDIILSIHGNASEDTSANGFECYPTPPGQVNHEISMHFAYRIADEMERTGATLRGTNGIRFGYYLPNDNGPPEKLLLDSTDTTIYDYDFFGILKNANCPAILVEQCFVTNAEDVDAFGDEDGCRRAAEAYYRAICEYLTNLN